MAIVVLAILEGSYRAHHSELAKLKPSNSTRSGPTEAKEQANSIETKFELEPLKPRIGGAHREPYETGEMILEGEGLTGFFPVFLAPFRVARGILGNRGEVTVVALLDYYYEGQVVEQTDKGVWLNEDFNFVTIGPTDTKSLVLAIPDGKGFQLLKDKRDSVSSNYGVFYKQAQWGSLEVMVRILEYERGRVLCARRYVMDADPPALALKKT
jgi:hypothetical protein